MTGEQKAAVRFTHGLALMGATILWAPLTIAGGVALLFGGVGVLAGPFGTTTYTDLVALVFLGAAGFGGGFGLHEWAEHHWCGMCEASERKW